MQHYAAQQRSKLLYSGLITLPALRCRPKACKVCFSNSITARPAAAPGLYDTGKNTVQCDAIISSRHDSSAACCAAEPDYSTWFCLSTVFKHHMSASSAFQKLRPHCEYAHQERNPHQLWSAPRADPRSYRASRLVTQQQRSAACILQIAGASHSERQALGLCLHPGLGLAIPVCALQSQTGLCNPDLSPAIPVWVLRRHQRSQSLSQI